MAEFLVEIAKLSVAQRIQLVQEILATIAQEESMGHDFEVTEAQIAELQMRSKSLAAGGARSTPWAMIQTQLIERYGLSS
jgi:putative addiction module component (TIGR02574 family)